MHQVPCRPCFLSLHQHCIRYNEKGKGVEGPPYLRTVLCEEWGSALSGKEWGFRGCRLVLLVRAGAVSVGMCDEEGFANICSVPARFFSISSPSLIRLITSILFLLVVRPSIKRER